MTSTDYASVAEGARFYADELRRNAGAPEMRPLEGARVAVIGATGLLGSTAVSMLSGMPRVQVFSVARHVETGRNGRSFAGSATDPELYRRLPDADFVLYIAGNTSDYGKRPWETVHVTLTGLQLALDYAARSSARLVFVSSTRVYGPYHDGVEIDEDTRAVGDVMAAGNVYDSSKRLAESMLLIAHQQSGAHACAVRMANVYGPRLSRGHFLADMVATLSETGRIELRGHPQSTRNYCFVTDAAAGLLLALANGKPGAAYNIGSHEQRSNLEFIGDVARLLPFPTHVSVPDQALLAPRSVTRLSIARAARELGYAPRGTLACCLPFAVDCALSRAC